MLATITPKNAEDLKQDMYVLFWRMARLIRNDVSKLKPANFRRAAYHNSNLFSVYTLAAYAIVLFNRLAELDEAFELAQIQKTFYANWQKQERLKILGQMEDMPDTDLNYENLKHKLSLLEQEDFAFDHFKDERHTENKLFQYLSSQPFELILFLGSDDFNFNLRNLEVIFEDINACSHLTQTKLTESFFEVRKHFQRIFHQNAKLNSVEKLIESIEGIQLDDDFSSFFGKKLNNTDLIAAFERSKKEVFDSIQFLADPALNLTKEQFARFKEIEHRTSEIADKYTQISDKLQNDDKIEYIETSFTLIEYLAAKPDFLSSLKKDEKDKVKIIDDLKQWQAEVSENYTSLDFQRKKLTTTQLAKLGKLDENKTQALDKYSSILEKLKEESSDILNSRQRFFSFTNNRMIKSQVKVIEQAESIDDIDKALKHVKDNYSPRGGLHKIAHKIFLYRNQREFTTKDTKTANKIQEYRYSLGFAAPAA